MASLTFVREFLTNETVLLGLLIICLYTIYRHFLIDRNNGLPPGPRFRLPLIGNMLDVNQDMRKFLRKYRRKYGDIYSLYFGNELTIVIAGYSKLKEALVKNGNIFEGRPNSRHLTNDITKGRGTKIHTKYCVYYQHHNAWCLFITKTCPCNKQIFFTLKIESF